MCSTLPGYSYYKDAACTTAATCCVGMTFNNQTNASLKTSCKLIAGDKTITAHGSTAGACFKRVIASKPKDWYLKAKDSMNDSCSSNCGDRAGGTIATVYSDFTTKVTDWKTKRELVMDEAKLYFVAKRLNKKLAAAYKTSFDVYVARWAAYDGVTGTDITLKSKKKIYDEADLLVTKADGL